MLPSLLFLLLLLLATQRQVHSCPSNAVGFDTSRVVQSLQLDTTEIYAGQYPCLPDTANGTRTLIRFAVAVVNPTECSYYFQPYEEPLRVNYTLFDAANVTLRQGYFNVSCVRDSICPEHNEVRFFTCTNSGLSPGCTLLISNRAFCQWVDVTGLMLDNPHTLELQLQPSLLGLGAGVLDETPILLSFVPSALRRDTAISTTNTVLVLLVFLVPLTAFYVLSFVYLCRRNKDVVIRYQYSIN